MFWEKNSWKEVNRATLGGIKPTLNKPGVNTADGVTATTVPTPVSSGLGQEVIKAHPCAPVH